jgi:PEP-CTERM motif
MKRILVVTMSMWLALACFAPALKAAPITGSIDFAGVVTFDTMSLATATRVNTWNSSFVLQDSGDFSSIAAGTNVTMAAPWIFNPSTNTPSLWSVGGFKFDLASSVIVSQSATFLNITGFGTISGNGFDPTPGTFSFTASDSNGQNQTTFGFQAQSTAVPEPSTVALLGAGISSLVASRKRRAKV